MLMDPPRAPAKFDPSGAGLTLADLPALAPDARPDPARFDPRAWFADATAPFEIEVGSGKGTFLVQQGALQPGTNFLGIEWTREFWLYAADRVRRRALPNVRLLHADATEFLRHRAPDACARAIHLYFPDPWPKKRHHKRRTVRDQFLADAHRALAPGGELRVVTDHDDYWQWMEEHFARWATPDPGNERSRDRKIAEDPSIATDPSEAPAIPPFERHPFERPTSAGEGEVVGTNFERKYRREGRPFHAAILRKPLLP